jgi:tRNA(Ile)-lysidine synthase
LDQPREAVDSYVRRHRLRFVEDPSNADPRHPRNRLRNAVWPGLLTAFPQAEIALSAAAEHAHAAAALAAEVLQQDLPALLDDRGGLRSGPWLDLPPARRRNALQGWLRQALGRGAPDALVVRLMAELPRGSASTWQAPGASLRLYRGVLRASAATSQFASPAASAAASKTVSKRAKVPSAKLDLSVPGVHPQPDWGGSWLVEKAGSDGVPAVLLRDARPVQRLGGERFSLAVGAVARSLKKQFQTCGIPAWQRNGPLLFSADGRLIWVPGLGVDARLRAGAGQPQVRLTWLPDPVEATGPRQRAS